MAASYLKRGMDAPATFSLYVRDLPPTRGFLVFAGLDAALDFLEGMRVPEEQLAWLEGHGFDAAALDALSRLRFSGEVWSVPEGRVMLAGEPLIEVTAPIAEAQLAETFLLNQVGLASTLASKAARFRIASRDRIELFDFSLRHTHGTEAGMEVARCAAMAGFSGTSNVEAARHLGLRAVGTMAHSYVGAFPSESEAFRAYASDVGGPVTFLVDTYDTLAGVEAALGVMGELDEARPVSVRLDSGDLGSLARQVRHRLDQAGQSRARILVSGGLDDTDVERLADSGAPVDGAGVGTALGVPPDAPFLDVVYKLAAVGPRPVVKLSPAKATLPGAKQVFRPPGQVDDVIGLRHQPPPEGTVPLLGQVMRGGRRTAPPEGLAAARDRLEADLAALPPPARDLQAPKAPPVRLSPELGRLADQARRAAPGPQSA
jgi:nicotinate phosphoribosyltransferase